MPMHRLLTSLHTILSILLLSLFIGFGGAQSVTFVDVTRESGIDFLHHSSPHKKYIVESVPGGVALLDFDHDGWLDIYFVDSPTTETADDAGAAASRLYRNQGDGTFEDVTHSARVGSPGWGMGACVGDYDGDGWLDLYVTTFGSNRLYRSHGDGVFSDVAPMAGVVDDRFSAGCAFADYDNDGDLDLFVANYVTFDLNALPEIGQGLQCKYRGIPVQCGPSGLPGAGDALFRNEGDGTFSDVSQAAGVSDPDGYYGLGVVWADFNGDGHVDLFVANDARPNFLYQNKRDGTFEEVAFLSGVALGGNGEEQACMGVAVADYDHDQRLDLYVTNFSNQYNTLYRNERDFLSSEASHPSRTAESSLPFVGWGAGFFDLDNDGWVDLLAVNGHVYPQVDRGKTGIGYTQRKLLYRNQRNGTFAEITSESGSALMEKRSSRGAAFGDLDNDGDVDIVVNDLDGAPMLLRNDGGNRNNWLRVEVRGTQKNRFAIGARVRVVAGDLVQIAEVRSGGSYLSQSDLRLHFGLEKHSRVDLIEVSWPGGDVRKIEGVSVNQQITIQLDN